MQLHFYQQVSDPVRGNQVPIKNYCLYGGTGRFPLARRCAVCLYTVRSQTL